jgi:hypothetical protein
VVWPLDAGTALIVHGSCMNPHRTKLTKAEQALIRKLQRGTQTAAELDWLERHLVPAAPTGLVAEVRHRLQVLQGPPMSEA